MRCVRRHPADHGGAPVTNVHRSIVPALSIVLLLALATIPGGAPRAAKRPAPAPRDTAMVLIPAGEFVMGAEGTVDNSPAHSVRIHAFHLDPHEVTNAEYEAFCKATQRKLPFFWGLDRFRSGSKYPDHPVIGVSWGDAQEYAKWRGKRLPTEAEWEYAARGGLVGMKYVDGNERDSSKMNFTRSNQNGPVAVGSHAPNGYGLYDMAGNVQEWVSDRYDPEYYKTGPADDPQGPEKGRFRVIRGGGWYTGPMCMDVARRYALPAGWFDFNVGFRCARDVEPKSGP
jgi:formylglycine-generating enzyme required for sulfatase activity